MRLIKSSKIILNNLIFNKKMFNIEDYIKKLMEIQENDIQNKLDQILVVISDQRSNNNN